MTEYPGVRLSESGLSAHIEPDRFIDDALQLVVDGTPQSHVNVHDPSDVFFEYIRRMAHVIDEIAEPGSPITAVHLGAGALTLPRYIHATRPGSRQQVIELERDLVNLVRSEIPWDTRANIRIRYGDAREVLDRLPTGLHGNADLVVVDIFSGARTPAHVTSTEFYRLAARLLTPTGVIIVNVADGAGLAFARGQAATLAATVAEVAALAEPQVLKGRRFGNVVLVGSNSPLPLDYIPRLLAGGPHPAKAVSGPEMREFIGTAAPVTDATARPSPSPGKSIFQVRR